MDSARGGEFRAFVDRSGKPSPLTPTGTSPAAAQVQGLLADFFPWVRPGLKVGDAWADTSVNTTGAGSDTVTVRRVTNYKAGPTRDPQAPKAVTITADHTSRWPGIQPTPQGPATIEGTGSGTGTYFVSPDGRYLGGEWQLRSALKLSGSFAKEPVPITVTPDDQGHGCTMRSENQRRSRCSPRPLLAAGCSSGTASGGATGGPRAQADRSRRPAAAGRRPRPGGHLPAR